MIVRYDPPPIPDRRFDWMAYEDEEYGPYGHGRTRDEAIADYQQQVEDAEDQRQVVDDKRGGL